MTLGEKLREARMTRGLTQRQVASATGLHEVTVARLEADAHTPHLASLVRLARVLELSVERLLDST